MKIYFIAWFEITPIYIICAIVYWPLSSMEFDFNHESITFFVNEIFLRLFVWRWDERPCLTIIHENVSIFVLISSWCNWLMAFDPKTSIFSRNIIETLTNFQVHLIYLHSRRNK